VHVAVQRFTA